VTDRVLPRTSAAAGFAVLERRWVAAERGFGWLQHWGSLPRDRAGRLESPPRGSRSPSRSPAGVEAPINPMPARRAPKK
jgi:hypothetical protein